MIYKEVKVSQSNTFWTKELETKEAKDAYLFYVANLPEIKRLKEYLEERVQLVRTERLSKLTYDKASWAYRQAELNGKEVELLRLVELLNI